MVTLRDIVPHQKLLEKFNYILHHNRLSFVPVNLQIWRLQMGMYTTFEFQIKLVKDAPRDIISILKYMLDCDAAYCQARQRSDHELFSTERFGYMFSGSSTLKFNKKTGLYILSVVGDFKNYDNEISKFIDWIYPYIKAHKNEILGWYRYETDYRPTTVSYNKAYVREV